MDRDVKVLKPTDAGKKFLRWARGQDPLPAAGDEIAALKAVGVEVTGFQNARIIKDEPDTIHFVVRLADLYDRTQDIVDDKVNQEPSPIPLSYEIHPQSQTDYAAYVNDPNYRRTKTKKQRFFELRIGEYCIGLCA